MNLKSGYKIMRPVGFGQNGKRTYSTAAQKTFVAIQHAKEWAKKWLTTKPWVVAHTKDLVMFKPGKYYITRK